MEGIPNPESFNKNEIFRKVDEGIAGMREGHDEIPSDIESMQDDLIDTLDSICQNPNVTDKETFEAEIAHRLKNGTLTEEQFELMNDFL